jgi:hypothetical protein
VPFDFEGHSDRNWSIDRIFPERGYVAGNMKVICMGCNRRKQDIDPWFLLALTEYFKDAEQDIAGGAPVVHPTGPSQPWPLPFGVSG